eukprot:TRINITY_DN13023_c0_g3_i1.p2 TRINITY_DN13023_c0_g3~~TRINITY_DN13023_c0_g3_i1.p2  ORF type:complete len:172 (-),score=27.98 TRINITY_DN13023_c0_g3_i1:1945-2460(-)
MGSDADLGSQTSGSASLDEETNDESSQDDVSVEKVNPPGRYCLPTLCILIMLTSCLLGSYRLYLELQFPQASLSTAVVIHVLQLATIMSAGLGLALLLSHHVQDRRFLTSLGAAAMGLQWLETVATAIRGILERLDYTRVADVVGFFQIASIPTSTGIWFLIIFLQMELLQ